MIAYPANWIGCNSTSGFSIFGRIFILILTLPLNIIPFLLALMFSGMSIVCNFFKGNNEREKPTTKG